MCNRQNLGESCSGTLLPATLQDTVSRAINSCIHENPKAEGARTLHETPIAKRPPPASTTCRFPRCRLHRFFFAPSKMAVMIFVNGVIQRTRLAPGWDLINATRQTSTVMTVRWICVPPRLCSVGNVEAPLVSPKIETPKSSLPPHLDARRGVERVPPGLLALGLILAKQKSRTSLWIMSGNAGDCAAILSMGSLSNV